MDKTDVIKLLDAVLGTEIANLQVERSKLSDVHVISAIDAVISAKQVTRSNLPK